MDRNVDTVACPAKIGKSLENKIKEIAIDTFNKLGCSDLCRIDIRLDRNNVPHVLDVNALPGLIPDPRINSRFPKSCYTAGMSYNDMILGILNAGINRVKNNGFRK